MSEIVHTDPNERWRAVLEAETIDCNSFDFNEKIVRVKVGMILFVNIYYLLSDWHVLLLNGSFESIVFDSHS